MTADLLPIGPHDHPEPRTMTWTQVELTAIREYAARCVAAERQRCIDIVESYAVSVGNSRAGELAAEWTMENLREVRDTIRQSPAGEKT